MRRPVLNGLIAYLKLLSTAGRRRGKLGHRGARALRPYLGEREEGARAITAPQSQSTSVFCQSTHGNVFLSIARVSILRIRRNFQEGSMSPWRMDWGVWREVLSAFFLDFSGFYPDGRGQQRECVCKSTSGINPNQWKSGA